MLYEACDQALTLTSTANVLVTMALGPLLTALVSRIFIGHRLPARTWLAILVAGGGIAWMYATKLEQGELLGPLGPALVPAAAAWPDGGPGRCRKAFSGGGWRGTGRVGTVGAASPRRCWWSHQGAGTAEAATCWSTCESTTTSTRCPS